MSKFGKRVAILICAAVTVSLIAGSAVIAGPNGKACNCAGGGKIAKALNLTPDQQAQIQKIRENARAQAQQIKQSNQTPDQKKAALIELRKNTRAQIDQLLTPDQRQQAQKLRQQRRGKMLQGIGKKLNLTPDQQAQIKAIRQKAHQAIAGVRANTSLTDQQKRDQIQQIRKQARQDIMNVLTPAQRDQLKQMRQERGQKCEEPAE